MGHESSAPLLTKGTLVMVTDEDHTYPVSGVIERVEPKLPICYFIRFGTGAADWYPPRRVAPIQEPAPPVDGGRFARQINPGLSYLDREILHLIGVKLAALSTPDNPIDRVELLVCRQLIGALLGDPKPETKNLTQSGGDANVQSFDDAAFTSPRTR